MLVSTFVAATLASAAPPPAAAAVDHSKMDHSKVDHGKSSVAPAAKMDCCKDGCSCCAKMKAKPTS